MPTKSSSVIHVKTISKSYKIPIKILTIIAIIATFINLPLQHPSNAASCPDVRILYARGSGAPRYNNNDYQTFKSTLEAKLKTTTLSYEFDDLDYPAIGITGDKVSVALGALVSGGESYEFGDSVKQGIKKLASTVNANTCKNTKYVVGGYSQGAMVISGGLSKLNPDKLIYAATFGDPKIYLPEGAGLMPDACKGKNLSDYRAYVPDCHAYKGLLGANEPYATAEYLGKVGTWCNKLDIFCSSHYNISDHVSYDTDNLYEDASRYIFAKIATEFNFHNQYTSPHDTAILIDSTGSMSGLVDDYKNEALRLAEKTFSTGGRVALYDYRDLVDGYTPVERCNFETCTNLEVFRQKLEEIETGGGDDSPESLLSASFHVMKNLKWQLGSTKSLVILTDAGYHSPDRDGISFYDVQKLSKQIDPVNFYIITETENVAEYQSLATATDGAVASSADDLGLLTDQIIERFDSLPRVEEEFEENTITPPQLEITNIEKLSDTETKINFHTNGEKTIVILNDTILGTTTQTEITLTNLRSDTENTLALVPLANNVRGESISTPLATGQGHVNKNKNPAVTEFFIPKAPNTGRL